MVDDDVRTQISRLLAAVRERPTELPVAELTKVQRAGVDVSIDRSGPETVVHVSPRPDLRLDRLTSREREVATLVAAGYSNQQIATALFISLATVKDHLHSIFTRTGFSSRGQLIAAWYGGVTDPDAAEAPR